MRMRRRILRAHVHAATYPGHIFCVTDVPGYNISFAQRCTVYVGLAHAGSPQLSVHCKKKFFFISQLQVCLEVIITACGANNALVAYSLQFLVYIHSILPFLHPMHGINIQSLLSLTTMVRSTLHVFILVCLLLGTRLYKALI